METILFGVAGFTVVILALVLILMAARAQLVQSGDVKILINGDPDKALTTAAGSTLLNTLADNQIFIPSACGGQGTCGVCRVHREGRRRLDPSDGDGRISIAARRETAAGSPARSRSSRTWRSRSPRRSSMSKRWKCKVRLESQCGDLHQGTRARASRRRETCLSERVATSRSNARRTRCPLQGLRHRRGVPPGLGPLQCSGATRRSSRRPSTAPTRWRTIQKSRA